MVNKQLRVLVAEDAPGLIGNAVTAVFTDPESQLELSTVSTIATLFASLELAVPEVIFLDLALGRPNPAEAVKLVHRAAPGVPLIVCAEVDDKAAAARSLADGANDYLLKGFMDARTIDRVLRAALERNTLEGLADLLRDQLTGLYTREGFLALGIRAMDAAVRSGGTLVLLCAMVENFSALRQDFGSAAAEQTIKETTQLLQSCFRRSDLLARLGKAQFCALAVDAAEPSAVVLRQRVESRVHALNQQCASFGPLQLRISVGFWGAHDPRSFPEFLDSVEAELRQVTPAVLDEENLATKT